MALWTLLVHEGQNCYQYQFEDIVEVYEHVAKLGIYMTWVILEAHGREKGALLKIGSLFRRDFVLHMLEGLWTAAGSLGLHFSARPFYAD